MTALVTSVVVEQPLRLDVRARPSFKRHARPFPAPAPQSAAALLLFTDSHSSLNGVVGSVQSAPVRPSPIRKVSLI
jgi:hypothetical protein